MPRFFRVEKGPSAEGRFASGDCRARDFQPRRIGGGARTDSKPVAHGCGNDAWKRRWQVGGVGVVARVRQDVGASTATESG